MSSCACRLASHSHNDANVLCQLQVVLVLTALWLELSSCGVVYICWPLHDYYLAERVLLLECRDEAEPLYRLCSSRLYLRRSPVRCFTVSLSLLIVHTKTPRTSGIKKGENMYCCSPVSWPTPVVFASIALSANQSRTRNIITDRKLFLRAFEWCKGDICTTSGYRVICVNVLANMESLAFFTVRWTRTTTGVHLYSVTKVRCHATQAAKSALASV